MRPLTEKNDTKELKKLRKKTEYSKIILNFSVAVHIVVTLFTLYMIWETKDLTPLAYLIPSTSGVVATAFAFYYNKAKAENKIKLMRKNGIKPEHTDFDVY